MGFGGMIENGNSEREPRAIGTVLAYTHRG
jgi:hypothetical protein